MSQAIERLLAIDARLDALWSLKHEASKETESLRREKSSILMGISWAERLEFDHAIATRITKDLDQISAVRATREVNR